MSDEQIVEIPKKFTDELLKDLLASQIEEMGELLEEATGLIEESYKVISSLATEEGMKNTSFEDKVAFAHKLLDFISKIEDMEV